MAAELTAELYSSNASVKAGGTRKVTVWLNASRAATAYEADIALSSGLSIQEGSLAWGSKINTAAHSTHVQKTMDSQQGTTYHILVYAADNSNLGANTGTAFTFTLAASDSFAGGTYQIKHQTIVAADGVFHRPADTNYEVTLAKTYITDIALWPTTVEMVVGCDTTLLATIQPATATVKELDWLSSDEDVLTVSEGTVTALRAGTATVTARATDGSNREGSARIIVYSDATGIAEIREEGRRMKDDGRGMKDEDEVYTLSGIRLDRITKPGIYIVGGKRVFVK